MTKAGLPPTSLAGRLLPDHLLSAPVKEHVEGLWQGARNDLITPVIRWSEMGSQPWVGLTWARLKQVQASHQDSAGNNCGFTSSQLAARGAWVDMTHWPWKTAEL